MPKRLRHLAPILVGLILCAPTPGAAQLSTRVTVTYEVRAVNHLTVSGDPGPLVMDAPNGGSIHAHAVDHSTSWSVATNELGRKVTASVDALPDEMTLALELTPPDGATSAGSVTLSGSALDLVNDISIVAGTNLPVTFRLTAANNARVVKSGPAIVTLTFAAAY